MTGPDFLSGLVQPLLQSGMLLPLLAAALFVGQQWGAQPSRPAGAVWALTFSLSLAVALTLSLSDALPLTRVPWPSLVAAALGGLAVAAGWSWGTSVVAALVAVLGAGVGLAALPPPAAASATGLPWALAIGLFAGSLFSMLAAAALVSLPRWGWAQVGVRVLGSWVAAASLIVLALSASQGWT